MQHLGAVVHIANVIPGFSAGSLPLPSEMFKADPQSRGLVEHPLGPISPSNGIPG